MVRGMKEREFIQVNVFAHMKEHCRVSNKSETGNMHE